jgi:hypothetical protein
MKTLLRAAFILVLFAPVAMADTGKLVIKPKAPPEPTIASQNTANSVGPEALVLMLLVLAIVGAASSQGSSSHQAQASDARLKTAIRRTGTAANGLPLYRFRYRGLPTVYEGVMAQDVAARFPEAVTTMPSGDMAVNYTRLGLRMRRLRIV